MSGMKTMTKTVATMLRTVAGRAPVSLALIAVMWLAQLLDPDLLAVRAPYELADWHVVTSGVTSASAIGTAMCTLLVLGLAVPAELALGRRVFPLAVAGMQLVATPVGLMAARAVEETDLNRWGADLDSGALLSPLGWILGVGVLGAARLPLLWRRRLTTAAVALSLTTVLYAGTLSDVVGLTAVVLALVLRRQSGVRDPRGLSVHETRVLVATVLLCVALGPLVTRLNPHAGGPLVEAGFFAWGEVAWHAAWLLVSAVIALGVVRGRRMAWWMALATNAVTAALVLLRVTVLLGDLDWGAGWWINIVLILAPWLTAIVVLLVTRRAFTVAVRGRRLVQLLAVVAVAAVVAFVVDSTGLFWVCVSLAAYAALVSVPEISRAGDRDRALAILREGTGDHLQQMTVWDGNRYWFAPDGSAFVAYRVSHGVAVTVGEPVFAAGRTGAADTVAAGFEEFAGDQGWTPVWYSVGEDFAAGREPAGYKRLHVADESILLTSDAGFRGKRFQNIRTARNHAKKEGVTAKWTTWAEAGVVLREQIEALSEQWAATKALPEMGFTLGGVAELADPDTRILVALDASGRVQGVTSWLPVRVEGRVIGLTLDMMRRDSEGFRPVIEFLLSEALLGAAAEEMDWISLSGAPLATDSAADGMLDKALNQVGGLIEPLYGFRSLAASKAKFHPEHRRWYLLYADEVRLPAVGLAVCSCYLPGLRVRDAVGAVRQWAGAGRR